MKIILKIFICYTLFTNVLYSQNTVGLISYNRDLSYEGYNLIYPHNQPSVFLLNNCGELVHEWPDSAHYRTGNIAYLTPEGKLIRAKRNASVTQDPIWAGGGGAIVEQVSWDNEVEWRFELNNDQFRLHHDIALMPNGNILMIAWEKKTREEAIEAGRDSALIDTDELWPDVVFEWNPTTRETVWEWHVWDHLVQDIDSTKENYGIISENPHKVNINYTSNDGHPNWLHTNSIAYDIVNDHILLSTPYLDEVWVIDHSTTTEEAATDEGGFSGLGGDLLYRWGNPKVYDQADSLSDQTLFFQHNFHVAYDFIGPQSRYFGKYMAFNNKVGDDYSAVAIWTSPFDMYTGRFPLNVGKFGPPSVEKNITHPNRSRMYSDGLSSVQVLPNDNLLILSGRQGYAFELTPDNQIVWEYIVPLRNGAKAAQGEQILLGENQTFRMKRYPEDFTGFADKDLSPKGFIEREPNTTYCQTLSTTEQNLIDVLIYPQPAHDVLHILSEREIGRIQLVDVMGRVVLSTEEKNTESDVQIDHLDAGLYFLILENSKVQKVMIVD